MANYIQQVEKKHYSGSAYRNTDRWMSYYHQIALVRSCSPKTILEIGCGTGTVSRELKNEGCVVSTLDIATDLEPDIVGSVLEIPLPDTSYDVVCAFEVLEHLKSEDVPHALKEMARVARTHVLVSLPHPGWVFSLIGKIPLFKRFEFFFQLPFFWKTHVFNGEHYWELGKKNHSIQWLVSHAQSTNLRLKIFTKHADDPAHRFFLFEKLNS
ncbi:class I SAM-dependent methyltransferase [Patescibacteria group bacterium]|nr:MAG: class I SAM-dependent methyltransferase [Patescibacteria group bacterium]